MHARAGWCRRDRRDDALQALWQAARLEADGVQDATVEQLATSAAAARDALPDMLSAAKQAGWNTDDVPIRGGACRLDIE